MSIIIIGAGGHGLSLAYHLYKKGISDIVLIEKNRIGYGSSGRNASRFRYHFNSKENVNFAIDGIRFLVQESKEMKYNPLLFKSGYLWLLDNKNMDIFRKLDTMWSSLGVRGKFMDCSNFDFLKYGEICYFAPQDGSFHHDYILYSYFEVIKDKIKIIYDEVEKILADSKVRGVKLKSNKTINGDIVAVTAGAWSSLLINDIPIYPEKKEIYITEDIKFKVKPLVIDTNHEIYLSQTLKGEIIGGIEDKKEFSFYPFTISLENTIKFLKGVRNLIKGTEGIGILRGWSGYYEMTPDHSHIMGYSNNWPDGLYIDAGYSGHGMMFSPFSGKIMADLIADNIKSKYISIFSPDRFQNSQLIQENMVI